MIKSNGSKKNIFGERNLKYIFRSAKENRIFSQKENERANKNYNKVYITFLYLYITKK